MGMIQLGLDQKPGFVSSLAKYISKYCLAHSFSVYGTLIEQNVDK